MSHNSSPAASRSPFFLGNKAAQVTAQIPHLYNIKEKKREITSVKTELREEEKKKSTACAHMLCNPIQGVNW